jgi:MFS family permease
MRLFATGGATLFLATYLSDLGFSDTEIGSFMALTLVGDLLIGVVLAYIGDRLGSSHDCHWLFLDVGEWGYIRHL